MDQTALERIDKLEKQMAAMIDRYNRLETMLERHGFDIAFIHAYINERRIQDSSESLLSE